MYRETSTEAGPKERALAYVVEALGALDDAISALCAADAALTSDALCVADAPLKDGANKLAEWAQRAQDLRSNVEQTCVACGAVRDCYCEHNLDDDDDWDYGAAREPRAE